MYWLQTIKNVIEAELNQSDDQMKYIKLSLFNNHNVLRCKFMLKSQFLPMIA